MHMKYLHFNSIRILGNYPACTRIGIIPKYESRMSRYGQGCKSIDNVLKEILFHTFFIYHIVSRHFFMKSIVYGRAGGIPQYSSILYCHQYGLQYTGMFVCTINTAVHGHITLKGLLKHIRSILSGTVA